jgi:hypothetical protein
MKQEAFHSSDHSHSVGHFKSLAHSTRVLICSFALRCLRCLYVSRTKARQAPLIIVTLYLTHILTILFTSVSLCVRLGVHLQFAAIATGTTRRAPKSP